MGQSLCIHMSELSTCVGRLGVREEGSIMRQMEVNSLHPIILYYANTKKGKIVQARQGRDIERILVASSGLGL